MRIAFALGSLQVGGTERQVCRLARELRARGHDVSVICLGATGPLEDDLREAGIEPVMVGFRGFRVRDEAGRPRPWRALPELLKLWAVWRALRRQRPDVCHAFLYWAYVLVLPVAWLARVPVRASGRRGLGRQPPRGHRLFDFLEQVVNRLTDLVVCNAEAVARETEEADGVPPGKIRVIPNGIDLPPPAPAVDRQPPTGVTVANLIAYKGHADLVAALALMEQPPPVRLVGEGPERERLEAMVAAAALEDVVTLVGFHPRPEEVIAGSQFAVLPSHEEGFPNAVLEAMAAGLPVVATRVGGVPELVADGVTGLLVPPSDPPALARAIGTVASDPDLRVRLGSQARRAVEPLSWPRCVDAHLDLYRSAGARG